MTTVQIAPNLLEVLTSGRLAVLATIHNDGRPQLSTVSYTFDPQRSLLRVSVVAGRAKFRNIQRDPRVAVHVARGRGYAVAEGIAELTPIAQDPYDDTVEELVDIYRSIAGEHPDWDDFRRAMVADRRSALRLPVSHVYGMA